MDARVEEAINHATVAAHTANTLSIQGNEVDATYAAARSEAWSAIAQAYLAQEQADHLYNISEHLFEIKVNSLP